MIHVHRADNRGIRIHHVRRIPGAAHADFENRDINRGVGELPDRHRGEHLEEAHRRLVLLLHLAVHQRNQILDLVPRINEIIIGQLLAVNGDPLIDLLQMRGRVQAGTHAIRTADRLRHARGGPLAVRASDVDDAEAVLRVAQQIDHHVHAVEVEIRLVMFRWALHDFALNVTDVLTAAIRMFKRHTRWSLSYAYCCAVGTCGRRWQTAFARPDCRLEANAGTLFLFYANCMRNPWGIRNQRPPRKTAARSPCSRRSR